MSKMKAVVLEKSGSRYTVLGQDGTFRQVHRRLNAEVGEEVQIQPWTEYFSGIRIWAGAVALFFLVLTTLLGWNLYQAPTAVALLSVDINPSVQFSLDQQGHLIEFQTQNGDAKLMLSKIDLKGEPIEEVLKQIVNQAYEQKFLSSEQHWIVVGYSPMANKTLEQMPKGLNQSQIISWVTESGAKNGLTPQVAVFSLTSQERELAQKGDLTLGEYALWQTADKAGVVTQPEKLKDTSERVRLLENPQVQVQIKAENNVHQSVLPQTPGTWKQDPGSTGKPVDKGTRRVLPNGNLLSPHKGLYPWLDKSRGEDEDNQRDQDRSNYMAKDSDQEKDTDKTNTNTNTKTNTKINPKIDVSPNPKDADKQKAKDQEKYQKKDLNKAKNSEDKETPRTRDDNLYIPPKPNLGDLWRDASRDYKFPEFDRDKQQGH